MYVYWVHLKEHKDYYTEGYIGISKNPKNRYKHHRLGHSNPVITEAFKKYGKENIQLTILYEAETEVCKKIEKDLRPKRNIGWNLEVGGIIPPNPLNRKHTLETRLKMSKAQKGRKNGPSPFKGKKRWTEEQKKLIGSYHIGKTITEEHKQAVREKLSRGKSPVASKISIYHTSNPNVLIESFECIQDFCDKYNVGYSAARSRLRRFTKKGKEVYLKESVKPHYFITYTNQD